MAKKKADTVEDMIAKAFGDDILTSGHDILNKANVVIPVSPKIDLISEPIIKRFALKLAFFTVFDKEKLSFETLFNQKHVQNIY